MKAILIKENDTCVEIKSLEDLIGIMGADEIGDVAFDENQVTYVFINPFSDEIHGVKVVCGYRDIVEALVRYDDALGDI
jgi:hypothetical protein